MYIRQAMKAARPAVSKFVMIWITLKLSWSILAIGIDVDSSLRAFSLLIPISKLVVAVPVRGGVDVLAELVGRFPELVFDGSLVVSSGLVSGIVVR